jgi:hypothetical protein
MKKRKLFLPAFMITCILSIVGVSAGTQTLTCDLKPGYSKASTGVTDTTYKYARFKTTTTGTNCGSYGRCFVGLSLEKTMSVGIGDTQTYTVYYKYNSKKYQLEVTGVIDKKTTANGEVYAYD